MVLSTIHRVSIQVFMVKRKPKKNYAIKSCGGSQAWDRSVSGNPDSMVRRRSPDPAVFRDHRSPREATSPRERETFVHIGCKNLENSFGAVPGPK
jgi:hypothetical protein